MTLASYTYSADEDEDHSSDEDMVSVQDAVKDLMKLERVHMKADEMKSEGNKFMVEKDYERALDCYSNALKLSPVGPNSHVYLSNRAAALLSLRMFKEAAVDARRAINLHATFGKAHARLGQALYYQKDFEGAVEAYENAVEFDPDNAVSLSYLKKARAKLDKRQMRGSGEVEIDTQTIGSFRTTNSVLSHWYPPGSDEHKVQAQQHLRDNGVEETVPPDDDIFSPIKNQKDIESREAGSVYSNNEGTTSVPSNEEEAERLHRRGHKRLARKEFQLSIEEFSAAIWYDINLQMLKLYLLLKMDHCLLRLCPDDPENSPKYYISRASAYFHINDFLLAKEDCEKSLHLHADNPRAYILLGKALYELQAYHECIDVMEYGFDLLQESGSLPSQFDEVNLSKAKERILLPVDSTANDLPRPHRRSIPKLPPPRFVSREEAIMSTTNVPSLPSNWPVQSVGESTLKLGPERTVIFGEGPMGIKLNRGPDGIIRVLSTSQSYQRNILEGSINVGDIVREMANVELRRPLTNIMWGDTVALIRMSLRPITLIVAKELSEPPKEAADELFRAATEDLENSVANDPSSYRLNNNKISAGGAYQRRLAERQARLSTYPSRSIGEESVKEHIDTLMKENESELGLSSDSIEEISNQSEFL